MKSFNEALEVNLIAVTQPVVDYIPDAEGLASYQARVSNPNNQENFDTAEGLLRYCARHGHWSVFETVNAVIEIKAPRDISRQILRHKSASYQEFSQRYAAVTDDMFVIREARLQDEKNRQNSIDVEDVDLQEWWQGLQEELLQHTMAAYDIALQKGIAKECARVILPEGNTMSCMYMNATMRTWVHYANLRGGNGTQKEHVEVAKLVRKELEKHFPNIMSIGD